MSDKKMVPIAQMDLGQLSQEKARDLVIQCEQTPVEDLWQKLSTYITQLRTASSCSELDAIESFTHVIYKGFYRKSEEANALRYFYWGYFAREQEEVVRAANKECKSRAYDLLASVKHFPEIMHYLYTNGCSQQKEIVKNLGVDKSNLSRLLKVLVNCGLITKISGPKYVFYELTHEGYSYYRKRDLAQFFCSKPSKRVAKLQNEACQIRSELLHLGAYRFQCDAVPKVLHTIRFQINTEFNAEGVTVLAGIPTQTVGSQYTVEEQETRYMDMDKVLLKESKYSVRGYPMVREW